MNLMILKFNDIVLVCSIRCTL